MTFLGNGHAPHIVGRSCGGDSWVMGMVPRTVHLETCGKSLSVHSCLPRVSGPITCLAIGFVKFFFLVPFSRSHPGLDCFSAARSAFSKMAYPPVPSSTSAPSTSVSTSNTSVAISSSSGTLFYTHLLLNCPLAA